MAGDSDIGSLLAGSVFPSLKVVIVTGMIGIDRGQQLELQVLKPVSYNCELAHVMRSPMRIPIGVKQTRLSLLVIHSVQLLEDGDLRFSETLEWEEMWPATLLFCSPIFQLYRSPKPDMLWPGSQSGIDSPKLAQQYIATILGMLKAAAHCYKFIQDHQGLVNDRSQDLLNPPVFEFAMLPDHLSLLVQQVSRNRK
jgi:hypothetical protein